MVDVVLQVRRRLHHLQQICRQVGGDRVGRIPASRQTRRCRTGSAPAPSACLLHGRRISDVSIPGSVKASPRSAASSSASARDAFCSAQPYGYSTRYRAPSPSPTSAVEAISRCNPPNPGTHAGRDASAFLYARIASRPRRMPPRFRARAGLRPGRRPRTRRSRSPILTVICTRARPIALPAPSNRTSTFPPGADVDLLLGADR